MSTVQQPNYPIYNNGTAGTPLYTYSGMPYVPQQQQQTVAVSTPNNSQIYNYPQTSIYPTQQKKTDSGVNIYIYNPSAIGGPTANASYGIQNNPYQTQPAAQTPIASVQEQEVPQNNAPIAAKKLEKEEEKEDKKKKNVVELNDNYIKTLESYIKSGDKKVRQSGIKELINRFEEDESRYDDPVLTALLNSALLDPDASNRLMAMSVISAGSAHGDKTTAEILQQLQNSTALYGQEALLANKALLKTSETKIKV